MEDKNQKDITGAIFLILLGLLFLLNTTGIVSWSIWLYLFKFWPIIIIIIGLRMVLPKNTVGNIIMAVLYTTFLLTAGITAYFFSVNKRVPLISEQVYNYFNEYQENTNIKIDEQYILTDGYENVDSRILDIFVGASELTLNDEDKEYNLYTKSRYQYEENIPTVENRLTDNILVMDFSDTDAKHWRVLRFATPRYELSMGQVNIPTSLDISVGAGQATVDLNQTILKEIYTEVGAGELAMTLGESSIPEKLDLEIGAGDMKIYIPESVGVSLIYNLGVGEIIFDSKSFEGISQNGTYNTDNYESANIKLVIDANIGVGELNIKRI